MKKTSKPIVFFGTENFSLTSLLGLIEAGFNVAAVVTKPDSKKGRGQKLTPPAVKILATEHNIPVWQPNKLSEITDTVQALDDPIGVLVSYGKILPQSIINLFTPGIINLHPSLLPKYRGPSPIESAIKNGDNTTGATIMQLTAKMDAGPIYISREHSLTGAETQPELYHSLAILGTNLLLESLPGIIDGTLTPTEQDESQATYCPLLTKEEAWLDFANLSAPQAERRIRAHLDFPKSKVDISGHQVIITKAHVSDQAKTPLDIRCQDGAFLSIDELITPNGRRTSAADFIRGYIN